MDRHNMKNIQLHYIQLTIIFKQKIAFLFKKRQNIFSIKLFIIAEAVRKKAHGYTLPARAKWHLYIKIVRDFQKFVSM